MKRKKEKEFRGKKKGKRSGKLKKKKKVGNLCGKLNF